jgi:hypothetical protein
MAFSSIAFWVTIGINMEFYFFVVFDCAVDERRTGHLMPRAKKKSTPERSPASASKVKDALTKREKNMVDVF